MRKVVKVAARFVERPAVELPHPLAAAADAVREAGVGEDFEVLGNALARDLGAEGESSRRQRPV